MPLDYLQVFVPIICFLINVLIQIFICRRASRPGLLRSVVFGFVSGLLCLFLNGLYIFSLYLASLKEVMDIFIVGLITYAMLGYCYFHFINLGETGRRVRILTELYASGEGLSLGQILQRYNAEEIFLRRIDRMVCNSQVIYQNGRYYIRSPVIFLIAKVIIMMKLIVLGKRSEFE